MTRLLPALLVLAALAGCATHTTTTVRVPVAAEPLPAGALSSLVVQPAEAPAGSTVLLRATGPADAAKIASFSSSPAAAQASLARNGFDDAYVAEYADLTARTSLVVTVVRFATAGGATAQVAADLAAPVPAGSSRQPLAAVGAVSGEVVSPQPGGAAGAQLVTVRVGVGRLAYLVAATGPHAVDPASVAGIARTLAARAAASPLSR